MGALGNLFKRILPIIMLVCFLAIGITHVFDRNHNRNITYLTQEVIYNDVTDNNITYYKLDTNEYMSNLNADNLKKSLDIADTLTALQSTIQAFKRIWEDGYQLFDITKTIANAVILVLNGILASINFIFIPIRILAAILLTTFTLIGINIKNNTGLTKFLNTLVNYLQIRLINPIGKNNGQVTTEINIDGTKWTLNDYPYSMPMTINVKFYDAEYTEYNQIVINNYMSTITNPVHEYEIYFRQASTNQYIRVYLQRNNNRQWTAEKYKSIIINDNTLTDSDKIYVFSQLIQISNPINTQSQNKTAIKQRHNKHNKWQLKKLPFFYIFSLEF